VPRNNSTPLWLINCITVLGIIILSTGFYLPLITYGENGNDFLFSPDSFPFGEPYKYWTEKWWEWNLAFPKSEHPNVNYSDAKCSMGQKADSPVWYLVQPYPGEEPNYVRSCTIPQGKAIITAMQAGDCNYGALKTKTDEALIDCAKRGNEGTVITVKVDNKTYNEYENGRRVSSDFFNVTVIPKNIMDYSEVGKFKAMVDGYYIFLKPLPPGKHVVEYNFDTKNPTNPEYNSYQHGTWNLMIKNSTQFKNTTNLQ
jgi:hypothetical protein